MEWFYVLFIISILTNYVVISAYIEKVKQVIEYKDTIKELKSLIPGVERFIKKHKKLLEKTK
jgi:hypothetical protein